MSLPPEQRETGALLSRLTGAAAPLETHISAIYVGAERTLKLKKAVALSFLDFTGLEARERFCRRELEINAPAAPGIYHAVHAVTRAPGGPLRLDGDGEAVDWVLEMATLPADGFLNLIAARHGVDGTLADALGDTVAALHATQPVIEGLDSEAAMQRVLAGAVESCRRAGLPMPEVERLAGDLGAAFATRRGLLNARAAAGHVRRCHGDLHLGNLVLWPSRPMGRPVAFDALEFDEALATVDTGYDLAFLLMDLDRRASRAAANRTLSRYLGRTGDAGLLGGLAPWLSLRAMVRSYCEVLAGTDGLPYLHAARGYLEPAPPVLLAIGGLPGTGKSWLARALAPGIGVAPGAAVMRSDEIRKRLAGVELETRLPPEAYTPARKAETYAAFLREAREALTGGHSVIADATFLDPAQRAGIEALAREAGCPFLGLWLEAPMTVLRDRIAARRHDASDADLAVLEASARRDPGPLTWEAVRADGDPVAAATALLARLQPA